MRAWKKNRGEVYIIFCFFFFLLLFFFLFLFLMDVTKRKNVFEHAQKVQTQIILRMPPLSMIGSI